MKGTFRRELKKLPKGRSGDAGLQADEYESTWPHFQSLFFLKDQVAGRASSGNMSQCSQPRSLVELETDSLGTEASLLSHEEDRDGSQSTSSTPSPSIIPWQSSVVRRKRPSTDSLHQQMLEIEREKLKALMKPDDEEDEVRLFCLSMVPKIKKLSPDRQSLFCLKMQEMLHNFLYPPIYSRFPPVPSSIVDPTPTNSSLPDQTVQYNTVGL